MLDFLLEAPWWLPTVVAAGGVVLHEAGTRRRNAGLAHASKGAFSTAALVVLVSWVGQSSLEQVRDRTQRAVVAFRERDWTNLTLVLHQDVKVGPYVGRDTVVLAATLAAHMQGPGEILVKRLEARKDNTTIPVDLETLSERPAAPTAPVRTGWQLTWTDSPDGWLLSNARLLEMNGTYRASWDFLMPPL